MSILLDILGSMILSGYVLLMGLHLNDTILGNATASMTTLNVQESMGELVRNLEYDFRKIGYHVVDPKMCIALADTSHIRFYADMDRDGSVDSVEWWVSEPLTYLPNPSVRVLYRKVNQEEACGAGGLGVTQFTLRYYNVNGQEIPPLSPSLYSQIWIIEISLRVESPYQVQSTVNTDNSEYVAAYWRQTRLASRNIKRHG
jgi:hypothetical protein